MESSFLTRDQALSLWSGSTDSRTLDNQRTNPRKCQIVRSQTKKPLEYKTQHHPTTSSTLCRTPHLNNKQNKSTNPIIGRQDHHLTQPCPSEEKQTRKQKLSRNLTLYQAYTNHWTNPAAAAKSLQSCPTLCNPMDGSPPDSPIPGILQARTLEWIAISFSSAWKWKWSSSVGSDS